MRAYDDGVAFRYLIPEQTTLREIRIIREKTQFQFAKDGDTWPLVLASYRTPYEANYEHVPLGGIVPNWLVALPFLTELPGTAFVAITEAQIENYPGMYLSHSTAGSGRVLEAKLAPRADEPDLAATGATPLRTPWRVLMIADDPGRLVESNMVGNLNPPPATADTSWIKPGKTSWDWWSGSLAKGVSFRPGMNTDTMKYYIDFSSRNGFPYMLIDAGWAGRMAGGGRGANGSGADLTKTSANIDMPARLAYAKTKNVRLWLWANWSDIDRQADEAFALFEKWGIAGVKIDFMNRDDQWMVGFYRRVVESAAQHHLMIDFHGAYKPDGLRRTYPNLITREGVMGKEYLKWSARTSPVHNTTLPFTRMLAGPMDYTPGAFGNSNRENFVPRNLMPMGLGTRAHELALFVVLESPLQMVSDYPEHYAGQHDFEFIRQVPTTWDEVRVLDGLPMQNITLARRSGADWYVGSLTNWDARTVQVPLSFLADGKYVAEIYADAADAGTNATHTTFSTQVVDRSTVLDIHMVSGGGNAIWIHRASATQP